MASDSEALKSMPWYHPKLDEVNADMRKLLEERGIPSKDVLDHVQTIRDKAWNVLPYPCIGMFSFTRLYLINHPLYASTILPSLLSGSTLLDLGSGFASDLRQLVSSGVPSTSLTALDNQEAFWRLGKDLYHDHETLKARFLVADMTDISSIPKDVLGTFDMIWAGASFHLFDWDGQLKASIIAAKLLKDPKGSAIYGYQVGRTTGKESTNMFGRMYHHDSATFQKLWEEVGERVGMKFDVKTWMDDMITDLKQRDQEVRLLRFAVTKVDGPGGNEETARI